MSPGWVTHHTQHMTISTSSELVNRKAEVYGVLSPSIILPQSHSLKSHQLRITIESMVTQRVLSPMTLSWKCPLKCLSEFRLLDISNYSSLACAQSLCSVQPSIHYSMSSLSAQCPVSSALCSAQCPAQCVRVLVAMGVQFPLPF